MKIRPFWVQICFHFRRFLSLLISPKSFLRVDVNDSDIYIRCCWTNFLETIFVRSAHVIYFYSSNVFFDVFRLLKAWLVFPPKGQTTFESKIVYWGGFHGLRCQPLAVSWGEINSNQYQSSWISKSKLKNMVVLGTTFVGLKICAL